MNFKDFIISLIISANHIADALINSLSKRNLWIILVFAIVMEFLNVRKIMKATVKSTYTEVFIISGGGHV